MRKSIFVLILLLVSSMTWAQAYKWRDASGRVQYSDTPPPPGAKDVQQLRRSSSGPAAGVATTGAGSASVADQDAAFRKRLAEKQEAEAKQAKATEQEQARARNCEQAKGQLAALESGGRMLQFNEKGERIGLDDAGRERARIDSQKAVDEWCK